MKNIPEVKLGIVAVSRDCFPMSLSASRREAVVKAFEAKGKTIFNCQTTVENEKDMLKALDEVKAAGCNALVVYLGNFGPESAETLLAKKFDGPVMFVAAAEEPCGNELKDRRGDAYCGMLNASYNLALRNIKAYIPEYPVGTPAEVADMIEEFLPVARAVVGLRNLKIITFGPRPQDFLACNAPIKQLYNLGVRLRKTLSLTFLPHTTLTLMTREFPMLLQTWLKSSATETRWRVFYPVLRSMKLLFSTGWKLTRVQENTLYSPTSAGPLSRLSLSLFPAM